MNLNFNVFSLERNFHYESRNVETENLKVIKKLTLNMIKRVKKKEETINKWEFTTFSENLQQTQKWGKGSKKRGNRSTNWDCCTFSENQKKTQKNKETDQQTKNLQLFLKTRKPKKRGNKPKKRGNRPKKWGNWSTKIWIFFF